MSKYDEYTPISRIGAYRAIKELMRDCLEIWVVVDPPKEFPFNEGDIVFLDDLGWMVNRDGRMLCSLGDKAIDYNMVRNANWAHRVSQWDVYSDLMKERVTLIDRSK